MKLVRFGPAGREKPGIIDSNGRIRRVYLVPDNPPAHPEAVRAILEADLIVLGPGSLYTSVLPNLLVQGIRRSIAASDATKIYVCNVATQQGETDGFNVADHVRVIEDHVGKAFINYVMANDNLPARIPKAKHSQAVQLDSSINNGIRLVTSDVISEENFYHHDPAKLAQAIMRIYYERDQAAIPLPEPDEELVAATALEI